MNQQTRRVRAGHPAMNDTEYLNRVGFKAMNSIEPDIEASQRAFMDSCEPKHSDPIEFAGEEPWTFGDWLLAFLLGFCVLMACAAAILSI